jgi:hypothetical protein
MAKRNKRTKKQKKTKRKTRIRRGGAQPLTENEIKTIKDSMLEDSVLIELFSKEEEKKDPIVEIKHDDSEDVKIRKQEIKSTAEAEMKNFKKTQLLATTNPGGFMILREDTETVEQFLGKYFKHDTIETVTAILDRFIST